MINNLNEFTKIISEPTRLRILSVLKKECCVGDLWEQLGLPQNLVSHHLKVLREAGLIIRRKQGLKAVYQLNKKTLATYLNQLVIYLK